MSQPVGCDILDEVTVICRSFGVENSIVTVVARSDVHALAVRLGQSSKSRNRCPTTLTRCQDHRDSGLPCPTLSDIGFQTSTMRPIARADMSVAAPDESTVGNNSPIKSAN